MVIVKENEMSKGSVPRPFAVSNEEYASRWDAIFGRDLEKKKAIEEAMDERINWPFPNKLNNTTPLDKLPFNPENEEDAPI
jgi:hypothetical protein